MSFSILWRLSLGVINRWLKFYKWEQLQGRKSNHILHIFLIIIFPKTSCYCSLVRAVHTWTEFVSLWMSELVRSCLVLPIVGNTVILNIFYNIWIFYLSLFTWTDLNWSRIYLWCLTAHVSFKWATLANCWII